MAVQLNHTIVAARDKRASADFLATILGLRVGAPFGPFLPVETGNGVTLDFANSDAEQIPTQHYAFLVSEEEFDAIFGRIEQAGISWAMREPEEHCRIVVAPRISGSRAETLAGGLGGGVPRIRSRTQAPRMMGDVVVPLAVTFSTPAIVITPPR